MTKIDLLGNKFGRLTPMYSYYNQTAQKTYWFCNCDCGNTTRVGSWDLRNRIVVSCGCYMREIKTTHGNSKIGVITPEYRAWANMKDRCDNPNNKSYKDYGGIGVTYCERWAKFENFISDVGLRPSHRHSLDRYPNPDGNYEPINFRWATQKQQNRNKRKGNNTVLTFNGVSHCLSEWVEITGLTRNAISGRLRKKWSLDKVLTTPLKTNTNE